MKSKFVSTYFLIVSCLGLSAGSNVAAAKYAFKDYERLTFVASYSLGFIYTEVAEISLELNKINQNSNEYHAVGKGFTYRFYDRVFKVRDTYESKFLLPNFKSIYFHRDVSEGGYAVKNTYYFDWNSKAVWGTKERKGKTEDVEIKLEKDNIYDVITAFYSFRNIDFTKNPVNTVYSISVVLDNEIFNIGCKYLGKETKRIKSLGKEDVKCLKFHLEVIAGDVFKGDEVITIWVSDDSNKIPLEMEFPIIVGKVRAHLISYDNLKYPLSFEK